MHRAALVMSIALGLGCSGRAPAPDPAPAGTSERVPFVRAMVSAPQHVDWRVPERDGQLSDSQLVALAPRIARLRAEPDTLRMDVTDSLDLAKIVRVLAIDDSGAVLGEVRRYTFTTVGLNFGPTGIVRQREAGTGAFSASISQRLAGDFRSRGPAHVFVVVTDSTGVGPGDADVPTGDGVITGILRDSAGRALVGANVSAYRLGGTRPVRLALTISDADGRYRFENLKAGRVSIAAMSIGHQPFVEVLELREGAVMNRDLQLLPRGTELPQPSRRP